MFEHCNYVQNCLQFIQNTHDQIISVRRNKLNMQFIFVLIFTVAYVETITFTCRKK